MGGELQDYVGDDLDERRELTDKCEARGWSLLCSQTEQSLTLTSHVDGHVHVHLHSSLLEESWISRGGLDQSEEKQLHLKKGFTRLDWPKRKSYIETVLHDIKASTHLHVLDNC